jgi:hypothetical protein
MLMFFIVVAVVGWVLLQTTARAQPKWERRWARLGAALKPLTTMVVGDVRALRKDFKVWRLHRHLKSKGWGG